MIGQLYSFIFSACVFIFPEMEARQLPTTISFYLKKAQISQAELAQRAGIVGGTLVNLLQGQRCKPELLPKLADGLTKDTPLEGDASIAQHLAISHLCDELARGGYDPSTFIIRHTNGADMDQLNLSVEMGDNFGILAREASRDSEIKKLVDNLLDLVVHLKGRQADDEAKQRDSEFPADQILAAEKAKRAALRSSKAAS